MKARIPLLVAACLTLNSISAMAQGRFAKVAIKATHVAGSVHMLEGAGGNIGVSAGDDGLAIVDTQFAPLAGKIEKTLQGFGKGDLRYVLNTHWHGDHTGGNAHFGEAADIVAHANVRKRLADANKPASSLPVFTFKKDAALHFNGEEIKLIHLGPGHTDGDSVIWFTKSKVVHMGDHFFVDRFPYIDLGSGGSVTGYLKNIEALVQEIPADFKIIPGHGPLADKGDLRRFQSMLRETIGIVRKGIGEGKTVNQLKAAGMPAKYKSWSGGFINTDRWIDIVYGGLAAN